MSSPAPEFPNGLPSLQAQIAYMELPINGGMPEDYQMAEAILASLRELQIRRESFEQQIAHINEWLEKE